MSGFPLTRKKMCVSQISLLLRFALYTPILFVFLIPPLCACPSLFCTDKEREYIEQNRLKSIDHSETLTLSAIIYTDSHRWTLWFNEQIIHATDPQKIREFHIKKVTPYDVTFSWNPPHSRSSIHFILRPNNIYLKNKNEIMNKSN